MTLRLRLVSLAFLGLLALAAAPAQAAPLYSVDNVSGPGLTNPPFTLGFQFTAIENAYITSLGVFDSDQNGLSDSHEVGLWDSSGALLASVTVPAGTSASLIDQFRYVSITPVLLTAGESYQLGALYSTGDEGLLFPGDPINFAMSSGFAFVENRFADSGTLANPTATVGGGAAYFGPNALTSPVPEPVALATWSVVTGVGLACGAWRRRRMTTTA